LAFDKPDGKGSQPEREEPQIFFAHEIFIYPWYFNITFSIQIIFEIGVKIARIISCGSPKRRAG